MSEKLEARDVPTNAKLVLIGGGNYHTSSRPLIEMGLDLCGKAKPNVLIVPTPKYKQASFEELIVGSKQLYEEEIGTDLDFLHGFEEIPNQELMQEKFDKSDVVYISGGNTRYAMELWKKHGIDNMLTNAMRRGKVMTGISAGAIAWFREGFSDSKKYEAPEGSPWEFTTVKGMGHIDALATPHYKSTQTPDGRPRSAYFKDLLASKSSDGTVEYGLGIDNNVAIIALDGLVRVVASKNEAGIYVVGGDYSEKELDTSKFDTNKSTDQITEKGISWEEFYRQLAKTSK